MNRIEHLLVILSEECAEVSQSCSKALRFGLQEVEPDQLRSNAQRISDELCDVIAVLEMLHGVLPSTLELRDRVQKKKRKVEKFLNESAKLGTLQET